MPSGLSNKKRGGRPKKFTEEEAKASATASKKRYRERQSQQLSGPADFIAYEPSLPDIPTLTSTAGLRISSNIRIPTEIDNSNDISTNSPRIPSSITSPPLIHNDESQDPDYIEAIKQIAQIRLNEQEMNIESIEYNKEIAERLVKLRLVPTANTSKESTTTTGGFAVDASITGFADEGATTPWDIDGLQHSPPLQIDDTPDTIRANNNIGLTSSLNQPTNTRKFAQDTELLKTPTQARPSPHSQASTNSKSSGNPSYSSKRGRKKKEKTISIPKNNLGIWFKPIAIPTENNTPCPPRVDTNTTSSLTPRVRKSMLEWLKPTIMPPQNDTSSTELFNTSSSTPFSFHSTRPPITLSPQALLDPITISTSPEASNTSNESSISMLSAAFSKIPSKILSENHADISEPDPEIRAISNPTSFTNSSLIETPNLLTRNTNLLAETPLPTIERTAFKLAKQLRNFQGCTHEQHSQTRETHGEYHQRVDIHSECTSLQQITTLIKGELGETFPDVLSSPKLMKPEDHDSLHFRTAFEGITAEDIGTRNENLPRNLCLSQHHTTSQKQCQPKITFDIDSICCFPSSLAFAKQGINWLPKTHAILNLTTDIHFGLRIPIYNSRDELKDRFTPLHKVPHYCFGSVIGMDSLLIFIFFPALHLGSNYEHSAYLSKKDNELFVDAIVNPAIKEVIGSSNILQHYPASVNIASLDSAAGSGEGFARKEATRDQLIKHAIQPQYLDRLWNLILCMINENPGFDRFQGATLFVHAKNTKLEFMEPGLTQVYDIWKSRWSTVADSQFYNQDRTFVDLEKQMTSEDSALPYDHIPENHEAEVFLWKKCCLEAYAKTREVLNPDGSRARGNPKRIVYPWAMIQDTVGQTVFAIPQKQESNDGLIYSQFYALIKTPFDSAKRYVFDNEAIENLALDPGYIRSLQQAEGGTTFSKAVCEFGYIHSKKRAHTNLVENCGKSYGVREEHRISLTIMEDIYQQ